VSPDDDERPQSRQIKSQPGDEKAVHKAKSYEGHKDPGLYEVFDQSKESQRRLRNVDDPEVNGKKKDERTSKIKQRRKLSGHVARQALRSTPSNQHNALNNY
jgi:hypothetical protein